MSFADNLFTPAECEVIAAQLKAADGAKATVELAIRHVTIRMQQLYHGYRRELPKLPG